MTITSTFDPNGHNDQNMKTLTHEETKEINVIHLN